MFELIFPVSRVFLKHSCIIWKVLEMMIAINYLSKTTSVATCMVLGFLGDEGVQGDISVSRFGDQDDIPNHVGAEFAQLAKELRSQFATAVIMTAERILNVMNVSFRTSITKVLQHYVDNPLQGTGE